MVLASASARRSRRLAKLETAFSAVRFHIVEHTFGELGITDLHKEVCEPTTVRDLLGACR